MSGGQAPGGAWYRGAARVFQALRHRGGGRVGYGAEQPSLAPGASREDRRQHRTALSALRYQDILEDVLVDSGFLASYTLPADLTSLALVLLHEFHKNKFNLLPLLGSEKEAGKEVIEVANAIYNHRTKLAAAFARVRIRREVSSISCLLSDSVRKGQELAASVPFCAWVNTMKTKMEDALTSLGQLGLSQVQKRSQLRGDVFLLDNDCGDVLVFPAGLLDQLCDSTPFTSRALVVQDRSRCVLAHCTRAALKPKEDVLFATAGSGLTPIHVAVLRVTEDGKVLACGGSETNPSVEELCTLPKDMGVSEVKFLPVSFLDLQPPDPRLQRVRVIVLMLLGSASGLLDPMDFLLTEGEDIGLMKHLAHGPVPAHMVQTFADRHLELLLHAMKYVIGNVIHHLEEETGETGVVFSMEESSPRRQTESAPMLLALRHASAEELCCVLPRCSLHRQYDVLLHWIGLLSRITAMMRIIDVVEIRMTSLSIVVKNKDMILMSAIKKKGVKTVIYCVNCFRGTECYCITEKEYNDTIYWKKNTTTERPFTTV